MSNDISELGNIDLTKILGDEGANLDDLTKAIEQFTETEDFIYHDGAYKLRVKYLNKSDNPDPDFAKPGDSGFDLRANLTEDEFPTKELVIPAGKHLIIPTGLYYELPEGFEIEVRPRSGLAAKYGLTVLNTPGTIDSGYRGEIMVIMFNTGSIGDFTIKHGDRIAQAVIGAVYTKKTINFEKVNELSSTDRGTGKFNSTGIK